MDTIRILRRSFEITWLYKALWVFGIILALTAPGGGGGNGGSNGGGGGSSFVGPHTAGPWNPAAWTHALLDLNPAAVTALIIAAITLSIALAVLFTIGRVVSETAVIRMADLYEATGEKLSVGQGFRLGWSRAAFRLFLIDLMLGLGAFLLIMLVLSLTLVPLLGFRTGNEAIGFLGGMTTAILLALAVLLIIVIVVVLAVVLQFFHRAAVLENLGVFAAIRRGWAVMRVHLGDTLLLALLLFALGVALAVVIIPLVLVFVMGGAAIGSIPGLIAGGLSSLFLEGEAPVVVGVIVALPIFLLVVTVPMLFISGLTKVFTANAWTLAYREMAGR